ncbi:ABC transporter substrate-binding protein [Allostreptomyces psammosilenae]|uniref:Osmoprotectant transport system substrate-binding protein n=1 Tax=Allostreptomyces psammosilenae TaxID=1892865 RepID=A0A853A5C2_9ACTN|nr:ABC transporter substrate-binding protein [Allostreptomyces psammosilenae]NYI05692.1 osmoprotectant transport system substrate-binding protein [Allostreptomyces psammosilenae]
MNRRSRRRLAGVAVALATAVTLTACGGGESLEESGTGGGEASPGSGSGSGSGSGEKGELTVGSAGFTESQVLAEMYAQVLRADGWTVEIQTANNRELYEPALESGEIDVVPEYAATLAEFLNTKANGADAEPVASPDVDATVAALRELAEPLGLAVLDAGEAVDQNAFAVSREFAEANDLQTLTDLGELGQPIRLAAGDECVSRPFCQPGLEETYGIEIEAIDPLGVGTVQAKQAVANGEDDMVLTTTTDATLEQFDLVLLEDDKNLQNADNVLPVVNAESAGGEDVAAALNELTAVLTTEDLTELNRQVDAERLKPEDVARDYLTEQGLL